VAGADLTLAEVLQHLQTAEEALGRKVNRLATRCVTLSSAGLSLIHLSTRCWRSRLSICLRAIKLDIEESMVLELVVLVRDLIGDVQKFVI
jgi:hypothetical protein